MTCASSGLAVVDLQGGLLADLRTLDIDEVDVVSRGVNDCPAADGIIECARLPPMCRQSLQKHLICDLAMELAEFMNEPGVTRTSSIAYPDILVCRE